MTTTNLFKGVKITIENKMIDNTHANKLNAIAKRQAIQNKTYSGRGYEPLPEQETTFDCFVRRTQVNSEYSEYALEFEFNQASEQYTICYVSCEKITAGFKDWMNTAQRRNTSITSVEYGTMKTDATFVPTTKK